MTTATSLREHLDMEESDGRRMVAEGTPRDWPWLAGSMERFADKVADGYYTGPHGERTLYRFIRQEAEDLFKGFADDTPGNRASYAAALFQRIAEARGQGSNDQGQPRPAEHQESQ